MNKNIKVSIILPTFNGSKFIRRSIDSVLSQSFPDLELIVVDDKSTENIEKIINEYKEKDSRIIYFKNEVNLGITMSLNKGLENAKGEYIARIDDDDEWIDKDKLKKQFNFLDNNKDYVLVGTGVIMINEEGKDLFRILFPETDEKIRKTILEKNCFIHSSVLFRKDAVLKIGKYSEDLKCVEDYDLWLRLGAVGKMYILPTYAVRYTLREKSLSSINKLKQYKIILGLIKKYKNNYPNYFLAIIRAYLRIIVYGYLLRKPMRVLFTKSK